jgi:hypothetical protein
MANDNIPQEECLEIRDFSGGQNVVVNRFIKKPNEVWKAQNADFGQVVGSIAKAKGYTEVNVPVILRTTTSTSSSTTYTTTSSSTTTT